MVSLEKKNQENTRKNLEKYGTCRTADAFKNVLNNIKGLK